MISGCSSSIDTALITTVDQRLSETGWSKDNKILIFSIIKQFPESGPAVSGSDNSRLFIYSLENKRILKIFEGVAEKIFFIINNWVVFDDDFGSNSHINIYNFINLETIKRISVKRGCGRQNIPLVSGFNT